jgi:hypothetical protein
MTLPPMFGGCSTRNSASSRTPTTHHSDRRCSLMTPTRGRSLAYGRPRRRCTCSARSSDVRRDTSRAVTFLHIGAQLASARNVGGSAVPAVASAEVVLLLAESRGTGFLYLTGKSASRGPTVRLPASSVVVSTGPDAEPVDSPGRLTRNRAQRKPGSRTRVAASRPRPRPGSDSRASHVRRGGRPRRIRCIRRGR